MRVLTSLALVPFYGPVTGFLWVVPIVGIYLLLQVVETLIMPRLADGGTDLEGSKRALALALLAANTSCFCLPTLPMVMAAGGWGIAATCYLVTGTILNSIISTVGSRAAFLASVLPAYGFVLVLPCLSLWMNHPPQQVVTVIIIISSLIMTINVTQIWRSGTRAKEAELQAVYRYIAARDENEARLYHLTQQDSLTGLLNRDALRTRLGALITAAHPSALLMIDLDGFKYVNDTLGHAAGDYVLAVVAERLRATARLNDIPARLGGDEFALLLDGVTDAQAAARVAERLIAEISQPMTLEGHAINIGASIGMALYPAHGQDEGQIFSSADLALYQAKGEGRHCARLFSASLRDAAEGKVLRDTELREALENGEFEIFYQPQFRVADGQLSGAEALLRWRHPSQGLLAPAAFISALEGGLLSARVGAWVLDTACAQTALWRQLGAPDFRIAVNLFGAQFRAGNLVDWVNAALTKSGLPPDALEIEITENIILRHEDGVIAPLRTLRAQGVGVAFDDYGTGFASLSMLTRYPVSRLKIDRAFTSALGDSAAEAAIVRAVIRLGQELGMSLTAEGVETEEQLDWLRAEGCDDVQGYYFGEPVNAATFGARFLVATRQSRTAGTT